jgi:hypothetical protein
MKEAMNLQTALDTASPAQRRILSALTLTLASLIAPDVAPDGDNVIMRSMAFRQSDKRITSIRLSREGIARWEYLAQKMRTSKTTVLELAIESLLRERGLSGVEITPTEYVPMPRKPRKRKAEEKTTE